ncbi:hypothetical protein NHJ6243_001923 [Beauveria neobassiana]
MSAPPAWLFSNNSDAVAAATPTAADPKTTPDRPSTRTMGKKGGSTAVAAPAAPALLMDIVERFLKDHAFTDAHKAFRAQRKEKGLVTKDKDIAVAGPTLVEVFAWWQRAAAKSDEDSADSSDSSESSDSSDDDENDSSDEEEVTKKQEVTKSLKRKAPESDSDSSEEDSDSDLSDSSDDEKEDKEEKPQAKKQKTMITIKLGESDNKMDIDSASDSDSDSSDLDSDSVSDSDSDSDSDSESDSDSDSSSSEVEKAAAVSLPSSDSSSADSSSADSSSDSDLSSSSSEDEAKPRAKKVKKEKSTKDSSDSSVTLDRASPVAEPPLPPAPVAKRKQNEPFSRIPKNIKVDARFASNEWVPMDYSQRAHEDLIITKGKGFTKAKNKMKKGSFRGGVIDITEKKAVYFED